MASDTSGSNEGWRVDNVNITWCQGHGHAMCDGNSDRLRATATATPTATLTPTPTVTLTPTPTATVTLYTNSYSYSYGQTNAHCKAQRNYRGHVLHRRRAPKGTGVAILGSARVSRAGFGVAPKRTFLSLSGWLIRADRSSRGEESPTRGTHV